MVAKTRTLLVPLLLGLTTSCDAPSTVTTCIDKNKSSIERVNAITENYRPSRIPLVITIATDNRDSKTIKAAQSAFLDSIKTMRVQDIRTFETTPQIALSITTDKVMDLSSHPAVCSIFHDEQLEPLTAMP